VYLIAPGRLPIAYPASWADRRTHPLPNGGGDNICSPKTHRELAASISAASGASVFLPDYRLSPEYRFPSALDDSIRSARKAKGDGVDVTLKIYERMWHVFHLTARMLPEARRAIQDFGAVIRDHLLTRQYAFRHESRHYGEMAPPRRRGSTELAEVKERSVYFRHSSAPFASSDLSGRSSKSEA
jgi:hypothetical protein